METTLNLMLFGAEAYFHNPKLLNHPDGLLRHSTAASKKCVIIPEKDVALQRDAVR